MLITWIKIFAPFIILAIALLQIYLENKKIKRRKFYRIILIILVFGLAINHSFTIYNDEEKTSEESRNASKRYNKLYNTFQSLKSDIAPVKKLATELYPNFEFKKALIELSKKVGDLLLEKSFVYVLFYDSVEKRIILGNYGNLYAFHYMRVFTNLSLIPDIFSANGPWEAATRGFDMIEKGVLAVLLTRFSNSWDVVLQSFEGVNSWSGSSIKNSNLPIKEIKIEELRKIFKHNKIIAYPGILVHPKLAVPLDCTIKTTKSKNERQIVFDTPLGSLKIFIQFSGFYVTQQKVLGVLNSDPNNMNRYYVIEYKVSSQMELNKSKYFDSQMESYKGWFENISLLLSQYDWSVVSKKIKEDMCEKAVSKILE